MPRGKSGAIRHRQRAFGFCIAGLLCAQTPREGGEFMLSGGTVHTISGPVIENGSVLVRDGKIIGVGRDLRAPERVTVIDVRGQQVYPGMIDSAGMSAPGQDGLDLIAAARANGVTGAIGLSGGEIIAGELSLVHIDGAPTGAPPAIHLQFPVIATTPIPPHEPADDDEAATTAIPVEAVPFSVAKKKHDEELKVLNRFFDDARRYRRARLGNRSRVPLNPRFEAMIPALDGVGPLFVTAVREREIREAIAFAQRQKIHIVLADAYECYKVLPLIRALDIPVVLGPPLPLPLEEDDPYDRSYTTAAELSRAGIRFSIGTFSYRLSRNLPYQAAAAVAFGLPHDEAYKAISLSAAEIFGLGKRLGSIDEGKAADLIVADGDPLEATTHVTRVFIGGKPVSLETRQKRLYDKYRTQP